MNRNTDEWHYIIGEIQHGPVNTAHMKRLVVAGAIAATDYVCKVGMSEWEPASKFFVFESNPSSVEQSFLNEVETLL